MTPPPYPRTPHLWPDDADPRRLIVPADEVSSWLASPVVVEESTGPTPVVGGRHRARRLARRGGRGGPRRPARTPARLDGRPPAGPGIAAERRLGPLRRAAVAAPRRRLRHRARLAHRPGPVAPRPGLRRPGRSRRAVHHGRARAAADAVQRSARRPSDPGEPDRRLMLRHGHGGRGAGAAPCRRTAVLVRPVFARRDDAAWAGAREHNQLVSQDRSLTPGRGSP